jgi:DNA invertase Pin-like site-specific DNA recombinase
VRTAAYIRVSDVSQIKGHFLDTQERLFQELCKNGGRVMTETVSTLARHNVGIVSITENLDCSTLEGHLTAKMIGMLAQSYSE